MLIWGSTAWSSPSQPVLGLGALPDEGLAMVDEQLDLARLLVLECDGQVRVTERRASDRERFDAVALPERARAATRTGHQLGRNSNHALAARDEQPLQAPADAADVLQRPQTIRTQLLGPGPQLFVPRSARGGGELLDDLTRPRPNRHRGMCLLVRVHSDNDGHSISLLDSEPVGAPADKPQ